VKVLQVPYPILFPLILLFCLIGAYSLNNNIAQILFMVIFGILGYVFKKFQYEAPPLVLALVLGPMLEKALRRSLLYSGGDPAVFLTRPISAVLLLIAFCLLIFPLIPRLKKKGPAFAE
jgi:putative tricarboxylic transport membrane protein